VTRSSTLFPAAEPPTIPQFEWPVVRPTAVKPAVPPLELSTTGRRGIRGGDDVWPAAALVNSGTYVGKAVHAKPRASR